MKGRCVFTYEIDPQNKLPVCGKVICIGPSTIKDGDHMLSYCAPLSSDRTLLSADTQRCGDLSSHVGFVLRPIDGVAPFFDEDARYELVGDCFVTMLSPERMRGLNTAQSLGSKEQDDVMRWYSNSKVQSHWSAYNYSLSVYLQ
jgi:hypothetical protein